MLMKQVATLNRNLVWKAVATMPSTASVQSTKALNPGGLTVCSEDGFKGRDDILIIKSEQSLDFNHLKSSSYRNV